MRWRAADRGDDDGTIMILFIFFALIVAALLTVVVDVSTVFLANRELQAVADGAATAAAQKADLHTVYAAPVGADLPLSQAEASEFVDGYVSTAARVPHECGAVPQAISVVPDGNTVMVELTCSVPLPFVQLVSRAWSDGVTIHVFAQARSEVTPAN